MPLCRSLNFSLNNPILHVSSHFPSPFSENGFLKMVPVSWLPTLPLAALSAFGSGIWVVSKALFAVSWLDSCLPPPAPPLALNLVLMNFHNCTPSSSDFLARHLK